MAEERGQTNLETLGKVHSADITTEDLAGLEEAGLVNFTGEAYDLTAQGRTLAEDVIRRHRLVEVLLSTLLGLDRQRASEIGCLVEHDLRPEMVESVCTLLGHPATCPHGRPIPNGSCCRAGQTTIESQVVPLTALQPGESGRVNYITPRHHHRMHKLTSVGLTPGVIVEVHQKKPVYCLRFEETELAVDPDVAQDIHVSRLPGDQRVRKRRDPRGRRRKGPFWRRWGRPR